MVHFHPVPAHGHWPDAWPAGAPRRPGSAGADGRIANLESEDCLFSFRGRLALDSLFDNGVESRVQQTLHKRVGRVVGTGSLR